MDEFQYSVEGPWFEMSSVKRFPRFEPKQVLEWDTPKYTCCSTKGWKKPQALTNLKARLHCCCRNKPCRQKCQMPVLVCGDLMHLIVPVSQSQVDKDEKRIQWFVLNPPCQPCHIRVDFYPAYAHHITLRVDFYILYAAVLHVIRISWALNKQPVWCVPKYSFSFIQNFTKFQNTVLQSKSLRNDHRYGNILLYAATKGE